MKAMDRIRCGLESLLVTHTHTLFHKIISFPPIQPQITVRNNSTVIVLTIKVYYKVYTMRKTFIFWFLWKNSWNNQFTFVELAFI